MKKNKYLIVSPGRTGSHIILSYFQRHHIESIVIHEDNQFAQPEHREIFHKSDCFAVHYHGKTFLAEDLENWTLIYSYREDLFEQYCSYVIGRTTGQWTLYPELKRFPKIKIDLKEALIAADWLTAHRKTVESLMIDNRPWSRIVKISYEQLIENKNLLFEVFPLGDKSLFDPNFYTGSEKSPYNKRQIIYRYDFERTRFYSELGKIIKTEFSRKGTYGINHTYFRNK